MSTTSQNCN